MFLSCGGRAADVGMPEEWSCSSDDEDFETASVVTYVLHAPSM